MYLHLRKLAFIYLTVPVTLVDYNRADYSTSTDYQFYFVFLREVLVGINGLEVTVINHSPYSLKSLSYADYLQSSGKDLQGIRFV